MFKKIGTGIYERTWKRQDGSIGKVLYIKIEVNGKEVSRKAVDPDNPKRVATTKREAESFRARWRILLETGENARPASESPQTFTEAMAAFLEFSALNKESYKSDVSRSSPLVDFFGERSLEQIGTLDVERYKKLRVTATSGRGRPLAKATINKELQLLSRVLNYARESGALDSARLRPAIRQFKVENHQLEYLTREEAEALHNVLVEHYPYLLDIFTVAIGTGMRKTEVLTLRKSQADFGAGVIHLLKTKSMRARQIPMTDAVRRTLERLSGAKGDWFFPNPETGKPFVDLRKSLKSACKLAGIRNYTMHKLRHTFGTWLAAENVNIVTIRDLLGHADLKTTDRYLHAVGRHTREAINKLPTIRSKNVA
jgi:integrase